MTKPESRAVPVEPAVARRHAGRPVLLNLTSSGSMDTPRDALLANP